MTNISILHSNNDIDSSLSLPSADDVLDHLYKNIFPNIENKFFAVPVNTKRNLHNTLNPKNKIHEKIIYQQYNMELAKSIFDFVVDNDTTNINKIDLLLEVYYKYLLNNAYMNTWLDINNVAKLFLKNNQEDKADIIKKCLELSDKRFYKGLVSITFSEDYLVLRNGYGTVIKDRKDFMEGK